MNCRKLTALTVPVFVVILLDQLTKHWIRLSPSWHNAEIIPGWLVFHYTQNPGMALGMRWASTEVISSIAIVATFGILAYVLYNKDRATKGYLFCMGLVLGGAFGNIIDRLIMGYLGSYGGLLEGHVIDFIYFNLQINGYTVFPYIFNVADIAISTAIISMLVFHRKIMPRDMSSEKDKNGKKKIGDSSSSALNNNAEQFQEE